MPNKFNESRRHTMPRARNCVTKWPKYAAALLRRESIMVWITDKAVAAWRSPTTGARGGQPIHSTIAIATGPALRLAFHHPSRQTKFLLRSIADLPGIKISVPDIGIDADTYEIVAAGLTPDDFGDVSAIPNLFDRIEAGVASMTADGPRDGEVTCDSVTKRHPGVAVIIPPRTKTVAIETTATQRDRNIAMIEQHATEEVAASGGRVMRQRHGGAVT